MKIAKRKLFSINGKRRGGRGTILGGRNIGSVREKQAPPEQKQNTNQNLFHGNLLNKVANNVQRYDSQSKEKIYQKMEK